MDYGEKELLAHILDESRQILAANSELSEAEIDDLSPLQTYKLARLAEKRQSEAAESRETRVIAHKSAVIAKSSLDSNRGFVPVAGDIFKIGG